MGANVFRRPQPIRRAGPCISWLLSPDQEMLILGGNVAGNWTGDDDGNEVSNPTGQHLESSITQLIASYSLTPRFALQLNVPLIYRYFERPEGFKIDRGTVSGLGDIALLLKTVLFHYSSPPAPRV